MRTFGGLRLIPTVPGGSSRPNRTISVKKSKFSKLLLKPFCQITADMYLQHLFEGESYKYSEDKLVWCQNINHKPIEYEIIGEGSQISTNQKPGNSAFSLLIGRNLRPFPDNFVLYSKGSMGLDRGYYKIYQVIVKYSDCKSS